MPSWQGSRRSRKVSRNSYHVKRPNPYNTNWVMAVAMVGVSIWSCFDGSRNVAMMLVAAVGTVALWQVLGLLFGLLRPGRLSSALYSGTLVALYMPAWDWLSVRWLYPDSLWTALGFGAFFGVIRWAFSPRGPSRPPS